MQRKPPRATRPVFFIIKQDKWRFYTENITFDFYSGFSVEQKRRSIESFHISLQDFINSKYNVSVTPLEISTKSPEDIGVSLSAFNLVFPQFFENQFSATVEMVFQSSKVFQQGGPYVDILYGNSYAAKKDIRLKTSGDLVAFQFLGTNYPLEPKTIFYDWIYIQSLLRYYEQEHIPIQKYSAFTDIEFNPKISINCQAKAIAIGLIMIYQNINYSQIKNFDKFFQIYNQILCEPIPLNMDKDSEDQYRLFKDS